jgi:hypothetical protein
MDDFPLDDPIADELLEGRLGSDEAPPELRAAAQLVRVARGPADAADEVCEPGLLASLVAARVPANVVEGRFGRRRGRTLPPKVAAAAAVFALLGGGVAAAATGSLPGPIQSRVAAALAHVGVSVPHPGQTDSPHSPSTGGAAPGAGSTPPSAYVTGLCTAYAASQQRVGGTTPRSTLAGQPSAVARLEAAAAAHGQTVGQYCSTVRTSTAAGPRPEGPPTTSNHSPVSTPHGPPSSVPHGTPASTPTGPPVTTPAGPPVTTPTGPPATTPHGPPATLPTGHGDQSGGSAPTTSPHAAGAN